jgi:hypothetical protein
VPTSGTISIFNFYGTSNIIPISSLSISYYISGLTVYFTYTATISSTNTSGSTLSYIVNIINSVGSNTTTTINIPNGSNTGSTYSSGSQLPEWGSVSYASTYLQYGAITSNTIYWQYSYDNSPPSVSSLSLSGGGGTGPGSTTFYYSIFLNRTNNTGAALNYTLTIINTDSPDLVGNSSIGISVANGSSSGATSSDFTRVNIGFSHYVSSYVTVSGVNSGSVNWQAGY